DRAAYGFRNEILPTIVLEESPKAVAPAAAAVALLATAILLDDHGDIHAHERTDVRRERAIACHDQYDFMAAREARHHLRHTRIHAPRFDIDPLEQADLIRIAQPFQRIDGQIQPVAARGAPSLERRVRPAARDRTRCARGFGERRQDDFVRVGETRLLAGQRAHTDALL